MSGSRGMFATRGSGILLHPTSLPGPFHVGDIGPQARRFALALNQAGQSWWQTLPIGPPGLGNSPYSTPSAFAGSPLLVSPEDLFKEGLLSSRRMTRGVASSRKADYDKARAVRTPLLREAFETFEKRRRLHDAFERYRHRNRHWLRDYARFAALKRAHGERPWTSWEDGLKRRRRADLMRADRALAREIRFHEFAQFCFDKQWEALRRTCSAGNVRLIGDVPIFVELDSADVWSHPGLFLLNSDLDAKLVSGIPPDYFSRKGQLWGNPIYRWNVLDRQGFGWWIARLRQAFERFDAVRLDHFIGFHRHWVVPADAKDAIHGRWRRGPGARFFHQLLRRIPDAQLIAEDLGVVSPEIKRLREAFGLPGMRVLQFAFGNDPEAHNYRPHNYSPHTVVYTGTHDNDTTLGWYRDTGSSASTRSAAEIQHERAFALRYSGSDGKEIHWDLIRLVMMSVARTVIFPLQDVLGLGTEARMNRPGTKQRNWEWRFDWRQLDAGRLARLKELTMIYDRVAHGETRG